MCRHELHTQLNVIHHKFAQVFSVCIFVFVSFRNSAKSPSSRSIFKAFSQTKRSAKIVLIGLYCYLYDISDCEFSCVTFRNYNKVLVYC